jgi:hypothetical protein
VSVQVTTSSGVSILSTSSLGFGQLDKAPKSFPGRIDEAMREQPMWIFLGEGTAGVVGTTVASAIWLKGG